MSLGGQFWREAQPYQYGFMISFGNGKYGASEEEKKQGFTQIQETIEINHSLIGVKGRLFFGGTFYITSSLSYESMTGKYGFESDVSSTLNPFTGSGAYLTFGLGNQWVWEDSGFLLACDWAGLGVFLGGTKFDDSDEKGKSIDALANYSFDEGANARVKKAVQTSHTLYLLLFQIGALF